MGNDVQLRRVETADLALFFEHHLEVRPLPASASASERDARKAVFLDRWAQMLSDDEVVARTIVWNGEVAGYIARFIQREKPSVATWLGRSYWGKGIATRAAQAFLAQIEERPLYARVAYDNLASLQILRKIGFEIVGHDSFFSDVHGYEIDEIILALN